MTQKEHYLKLAVECGGRKAVRGVVVEDEDAIITLCTRVAKEARESALEDAAQEALIYWHEKYKDRKDFILADIRGEITMKIRGLK